ncbi:MAG: tetratricopeptide repeat protein, partial [Proteobacteria bacterium]|nr:tetratricopeptide repeat protein [Pseudomonadota bacterium]
MMTKFFSIKFFATFTLLILGVPASELSSVSFALESKVESQHVIIRSSFQEKDERPTISIHQYDLKSIAIPLTNYQPVLDFTKITWAQDFPDSVSLHWLTTTSVGFAEFYLGDRGIFETGVLLYRQGKYKQAINKFKLLRTTFSPYLGKATLWLAWAYYKLDRFNESQRILQDLLQSKSSALKQEALYLSFQNYHRLDNWLAAVKELNPFLNTIPKMQWDNRLIYLFLVNLVDQKKWSTAEQFLNQINRSALYYSKLFHKITELEGLIAFKSENYKTAIKKYSLAKQLDSNPGNRFIYEKALAWSRYKSGHYQQTILGLANKNSRFWKHYFDEMEYLKLRCYLQLKDWDKVKSYYAGLSKQSRFYLSASFLLRSGNYQIPGHEELKTTLSKLNYETPEMKYYSAFLNGTQYFKKNNFPDAERSYTKALSHQLDETTQHAASYNLALTYLKEEKLKESLDLFKTMETDPQNWLHYHQLYIHYLLKEDQQFIEIFNHHEKESWQVEHLQDLLFMNASIYLSRGEYSKAATGFIALWNKTKQVAALEYTAKAFYRNRNYKKVVGLTKSIKTSESDILFSYRIRSLLGLREFNKAELELKARNIQGDKLIELRMEVWLASKQYKKITEIIPVLLQQSLSKDKRIFYYLSLGDVYFNLQEYPKSKNQFYKALAIAETSSKRSVIYYNIVLSTFFSDDKVSFLREIDQILKKKELSDNIRYNLMLLQVDYYFTEGDRLAADDILTVYIQKYLHKRNQAYLKRIKLLFKDQQFKQCFYLAQTPPGVEDVFQSRDRLIIGAKCSRTRDEDRYVVRILSRELAKKDSYRINELSFILAKAYFKLKQYGKSVEKLENLDLGDAHETIKIQAKLLLAENYLLLKKAKKAQSVLGDVNLLRHSSYYPDALLLSSNITEAQSRTGEALRSMLRIYYLKTTPVKEKQNLLLKMTNLMVKKKDKKKALKYYKL